MVGHRASLEGPRNGRLFQRMYICADKVFLGAFIEVLRTLKLPCSFAPNVYMYR